MSRASEADSWDCDFDEGLSLWTVLTDDAVLCSTDDRDAAILMAAAPSLLAALKGLLDQLTAIGIPDWHGAEGLSLDQARAAIRRAT